MAEVHFFMTRNDSLAFVSFLIELVRATFVPERSLDPPPFLRLTSSEQVRIRMDQNIQRYYRFFVLSPQWERLPLVYDEIHANDGQHFYSVSQRYGGPAFDFLASGTYSEGEMQWIRAGWFSDYPYYIEDKAFLKDASLYRVFQRPEKMTVAFKEVQRYLRKNGFRSRCRETGHTGPWIGIDALKQHEAGMWLRGGDWHYEPKGNTSRSRRTKR